MFLVPGLNTTDSLVPLVLVPGAERVETFLTQEAGSSRLKD